MLYINFQIFTTCFQKKFQKYFVGFQKRFTFAFSFNRNSIQIKYKYKNIF